VEKVWTGVLTDSAVRELTQRLGGSKAVSHNRIIIQVFIKKEWS